MQGRIHTVWRALMAVAVVLAGWVPVTLAVIYGGSYVLRCYHALTSPGVPIEYQYESEAGEMVFRADGYQIDPVTKQGVVSRVRILAPDGSEVLTVGKVNFVMNGDVPTITVSNVVASVTRLADGSFDLQKMLPLEEEEETDAASAFRLVVNQATINYSDETIPDESVELRLRRMQMDGADGAVIFRTLLESDTLKGEFAGSALSDGSLWFKFDSESSEFAGLMAFLNPVLPEDFLGEFAHVSARSLIVDGSVEVWSPAERPLSITGALTIKGESVETPYTLNNSRLLAHLVSDGTDIKLDATLAQSGLDVAFDGRMRMADPFWIEGDLAMDVLDHASLPPQIAPLINPVAIFANASFDGWFETDGEKFLLDGDTVLAQVTYGDDTATGIKGRTRLDNWHLAAEIEEAEWSEVSFAGAVGIEFENSTLTGHLNSKRGRIEPIAERFGTDKLKGVVSISAILTGTTDSPVADIYASGSGGVQVVEGPLMSLGVFEVRGRVDGEGAHLDRMTMTGQNGVVAASGSMAWVDRALAFKVDAGGIDINSFNENFEGLGFVEADISGTIENPKFEGRAELYGTQFFDRSVPQIVSDWTATGEQISFERLAARAGSGQIDGSATIQWSDYALNGSFEGSGVRLEEWLTQDFVGSVRVRNGTIGGTLQEPDIGATLTAGAVLAGGIKLDGARAPVRITKDFTEINDFLIAVGGGTVKGQASYRDGIGTVEGVIDSFPLDRVVLSDQLIALDGATSGNFDMKFENGALTGGKLNAELLAVEANSTPVGSGSVNASVVGDEILVDAQVGSLERYVLLTNGKYGLKTKDIGGDIEAFNFPVEDLASVAKKPTENWPKNITDMLDVVSGSTAAGISLSGQPDDLNIDVSYLEFYDLVLSGRSAGSISALGSRSGGKWLVSKFEWNDMATEEDTEKEFVASGEIDEAGSFDLTAELSNFDVSWLHTAFPSVPLLAGTINNLTVENARGTFDNPTAKLKFDAENLDFYDGTEVVNLRAKITNGEIDVADRLFDLSGDLEFLGLNARLNGFVPFSSLYEPADEAQQPMNVQVSLNEDTHFSDFEPYLGGYDAERTSGRVAGSAWIAGLLGDFSIGGDLQLKGDSFALKGHETALENIDLNVTVNDWTTTVSGTVSSSLGGTAKIDLDDEPLIAVSPDLLAGDVAITQFLERTTLSGKVVVDKFKTAFTLPTARGASSAVASVDALTFGGTLASPVLGGEIELSDVNVLLPEELEESTPTTYSINPIFDGITIRAAQGSRLDSGNAQIDFFGNGRLAGSLQNPEVSLPLTVSGGVFELPTARITLESGGSINVGYRSSRGTAPTARVDLNLEGRTNVSARRVSNQYETYEVQLNIRGNLLEDGGLQIQASSDPPDLTSDQIMAILGRKDLIEGIARGGQGSGLRDTFFSAALPAASNLFTSDLAKDLGLDYISLDYNPFDQAVAGAGKTIGKGLMLHGRRQLSTPTVGRLKYELLFTYRLPMREAFFSRLRFSFGLDQDVPWRLGLNWARRF